MAGVFVGFISLSLSHSPSPYGGSKERKNGLDDDSSRLLLCCGCCCSRREDEKKADLHLHALLVISFASLARAHLVLLCNVCRLKERKLKH